MHPSSLARLFNSFPVSLDDLQNQNRKSPTRFARDCPGRTGWKAAQLREHSPRRRRLRTSRPDHSWLKVVFVARPGQTRTRVCLSIARTTPRLTLRITSGQETLAATINVSKN